eukprot:g1119.t1
MTASNVRKRFDSLGSISSQSSETKITEEAFARMGGSLSAPKMLRAHRSELKLRRVSMSGIRQTSTGSKSSLRKVKSMVPKSLRKFPTAEDAEEVLRNMFESFDTTRDGRLTLEEFELICLEKVRLNLTPSEVGRIFQLIDSNCRGWLDFNQFKKAIQRRRFFSAIVSSYAVRPDFQVSPTYDYSKSTSDNYAMSDPNCMDFYGDFVSARRKLDYDYHVNYTKERQLWQDAIIKSVVQRTEPQPNPWVVYTCGPMGAGKGYALSWMSRYGYFPLENIVHVDPDHFKTLMPEWNEYVSRNSDTAGTLCHRESGYMQEIAQELGLRGGQNLWIDGSLRDGNWFSQVFTSLRQRFPQYRIAIFYVYCSEKEVRRRVAKRAKETGRVVPEAMIQMSLDSPDRSIRLLTPKCDFVARINNEHKTPVLEAFETVDRSGRWHLIADRFAGVHSSPADFPESLSPIYVSRLPPVAGYRVRALKDCTFGLRIDDPLTLSKIEDHKYHGGDMKLRIMPSYFGSRWTLDEYSSVDAKSLRFNNMLSSSSSSSSSTMQGIDNSRKKYQKAEEGESSSSTMFMRMGKNSASALSAMSELSSLNSCDPTPRKIRIFSESDRSPKMSSANVEMMTIDELELSPSHREEKNTSSNERTDLTTAAELIEEKEREAAERAGKSSPRSLAKEWREATVHRNRLKQLRLFLDGCDGGDTLSLSPSYPVNMGTTARKLALIPDSAHYFCFIYPSPLVKISKVFHGPLHLSSNSPKAARVNATTSLNDVQTSETDTSAYISRAISLLCFGGFAYFDVDDVITAVNVIDAKPSKNMLQFGNPKKLDYACAVELESNQRWRPTAQHHWRSKGALYYAWITPGEKLGGRVFDRYGGFAYLFWRPSDEVQEEKVSSNQLNTDIGEGKQKKEISSKDILDNRKQLLYNNNQDDDSVQSFDEDEDDFFDLYYPIISK